MIKIIKTFLKGKNKVYKNLSHAIERHDTLPDYDFSLLFFETLKSYHIDLIMNNNNLIKMVVHNKAFKFLNTFWSSKKVRKKLKKSDFDIYLYCKSHYDFEDAIKSNNISC